MSDRSHPMWPRFKMVMYSRPTGIPNGWDEELLEKGAPDGIGYEVIKELMLLENPESGPLVSFGIRGIYHRVCLDPRTNRVVHIGYGALRVGETHPMVFGTVGFINSSLDQFIESVRAATVRFPYDTTSLKVSEHLDPDRWDLSDEDWEKLSAEHDKAARDLMEMLGQIDPAAVAEQGFWTEFGADVQMGDYATRYWRSSHAT